VGGARPDAVLACLLPARGSYFKGVLAAVKQVSGVNWANLAQEASTRGVLTPTDAYRAVAQGLLDATLGVGAKVSTNKASHLPISVAVNGKGGRLPGTQWVDGGSGDDPYVLPTTVITASANVAVFDVYMSRSLFDNSQQQLLDSMDWLNEIAEEQWTQDCAEWNSEMDQYDATKASVAATADDLANELEDIALQMENAIAPLEDAQGAAICKPTSGKKMCIDFFIMDCWIAGFEGDCRNFDPNADYSNSRVQLYIDPTSRAWEVKYNCSVAIIPGDNTGPHTFCDSAQVFDPTRDVQTSPPDANGWYTVTVAFRNNACLWHGNPACPSIDATVKYRPNPLAPGGYEVTWNRDGFPSMGVYIQHATDAGFDTAAEDAQKTHWGINAIRALAGQIRSKGYNYPPPGNQPPGCDRQ
jgi:hypothetical protein